MTPTALIQPVATFGPFSVNTGAYGIISQADGSYLAGVSHSADSFPFPTSSEWYRSTDNGATWSARGSYNGLHGQQGAFPTNIHENILVAHADQPANNSIEIYRSTDGAGTFGTVYSASVAPSPNGRTVKIWGLQSYQRTKAIAWGELDGDNQNPAMLYAISTNAGASWTPVNTFDSGNQFDHATGFGLAAGGTFYMTYIKFGGQDRQSWLARSNNYGSSWTPLLRTRRSDNTGFVFISPISCFDSENFCCGGIQQSLARQFCAWCLVLRRRRRLTNPCRRRLNRRLAGRELHDQHAGNQATHTRRLHSRLRSTKRFPGLPLPDQHRSRPHFPDRP